MHFDSDYCISGPDETATLKVVTLLCLQFFVAKRKKNVPPRIDGVVKKSPLKVERCVKSDFEILEDIIKAAEEKAKETSPHTSGTTLSQILCLNEWHRAFGFEFSAANI